VPDKASEDTFAVGATMAASDASLAPRSRRASTSGADYTELVEVDPKHYAMGDELARGGMGRILRARDRRLGRSVAIKEVLSGHDDVRFEREARITARLQHPSIVAVHEAGRWPSGEAFYAMKLVAGTPLDKRIAEAKSLAERLALVPNVIAVVDALAYAHSERVIHRDLKPSNVLCGAFGETVVIDWGLAKDLAAGDTDEQAGPFRSTATAGETVAGAVIGTPAYMPPEQAAGEPVDERADVYALGAILYHVLAGLPPYEGKSSDDVLERVLARAPKTLADRDIDAPLELLAIVGKAMARSPAERFASAQQMADELHRFQTGQLVTSHRYTWTELVRRWVRRHRGAIAVGAIAVVTVAILAVVGLAKILAEGRRADRETAVAQARTDAATLDAARAALDSDPTETLALLAKLGPGAPEWRAARTFAADAIARGVAHTLTVHGRVMQLAFSRDGAQLAAIVDDESAFSLHVWDVATWQDKRFDAGATYQLGIGFAPNGDILHVTGAGAIDRWNPASNVDAPLRSADGEYGRAVVAPTGRYIAMFQHEGGTLFDVRTGTERALAHYAQGAWSPDGETLIAWDRNDTGKVDRIDLATGQPTFVGGNSLTILSLATDGVHAWAGTYRGDLYELASGARKIAGRGEHPITALAMLPGGVVAMASSHYEFKEARDDTQAFVGDYTVALSVGGALRGHRQEITALASSRDGRIASADLDGEIRIWQRAPATATAPDGHTTTFVARGAQPGQLVLAHRNPALEVLDIATGHSRTLHFDGMNANIEAHIVEHVGDAGLDEVLAGPGDAVTALERSRDGRRFVTLDAAKHAIVWDLDRGGRKLAAEDVHHVAISADGKRVATSNDDGVWLWDADTGVGAQRTQAAASALALSSDGSKLALGLLDGRFAMFDKTGLGTAFPVELDTYNTIVFAPDDRYIAAGGTLAKVRVIDRVLFTQRVFTGHAGTITKLVFDRDGARLASAATDLAVRVWDMRDGAVQVLRGHGDTIASIEFADDRLFTASADRTARVWDLRTNANRTLGGHADRVVYAGVMPSGELVTIDHDDRRTTYSDALPVDELGLRAWLAQRMASQ
jgi:WD40 repeat protein/tRNA A-37 threonylcarbamoyl transferase component Bud32